MQSRAFTRLQAFNGGAYRIFGQRFARGVGEARQQAVKIAIVDESDAVFGRDQHDARIVYPRAVNARSGPPGMGLHAIGRAGGRVPRMR